MKSEIRIDLEHINVTNLITEADFMRKAQEILPEVLVKIGEETGKILWEQMQKSFRNIRGLKINNSLSDKNRFIREKGLEYRKNVKQNETHVIEKQIIDKLKLKKESQFQNQDNSIKRSEMPYQATVYRVFIASPSDVTDEREIVTKVIDDWNAINSVKNSIVLLPIRWETHSYPQTGLHPQKIINKQILLVTDQY